MNLRDVSSAIRRQALQAVDPTLAVSSYLTEHPSLIERFGRVDIVSIGKAAGSMARAVLSNSSIHVDQGIIVTKSGHAGDYPKGPNITVRESGHPVPTNLSVEAASEVVRFLEHSSADTVLFLLSGGASSLITQPVAGISLEDMQTVTHALLSCGAPITEINTIRKHLDTVKGGGLLRFIHDHQRICTFVLSDVIGDDLSVIASSPTYWDNSSFKNALEIIERYEIANELPQTVLDRLHEGRDGKIPETLKKDDSVFSRASYHVVGNLIRAVDHAAMEAKQHGFTSIILRYDQQGEASRTGEEFAQKVRDILADPATNTKPLCLVFGGETTVTLNKEQNGTGGRSQELILSVLKNFPFPNDRNILFSAFGTDGTDGPTDAAGAFIDREMREQMNQLNLHPEDYLKTHNSYEFFQKVGALIKTGPTGTNVGDITFVLIEEKS